MLLAVDVGNTHTTLGVFRGARLTRAVKIPTPAWRTEAAVRLPGRRSLRGASQAIVCSVVPWATPKVTKALRAAGCERIILIGRHVKVPLKNRYRYPKQVGQDRLVGAYAAWCLYGDGARPDRPRGRNPERARQRESRDCIVADFGTAITIDLVSRKGEYLGGVIAPGLDMSIDALHRRTALLPRTTLKTPPGLLGRDTIASMRSGVLFGAGALCDGLISALKARYATKATVVGTGGDARLVSRYCRSLDVVNPHLVLQGLRLLV